MQRLFNKDSKRYLKRRKLKCAGSAHAYLHRMRRLKSATTVDQSDSTLKHTDLSGKCRSSANNRSTYQQQEARVAILEHIFKYANISACWIQLERQSQGRTGTVATETFADLQDWIAIIKIWMNEMEDRLCLTFHIWRSWWKPWK